MKALTRSALCLLALAACRDANAPIPASARNGPEAAPPQLTQQPLMQQPVATAPSTATSPGQTPQTQAPLPPPEERIKQIQVATLPATLHKVDVTFGGGLIRYLGYEVDPPNPQLGQRFRVTHYWRAEKAVPADWTIFVHFGIPNQPGNIANADHVPAAGAYPSSKWKPGAAFRDDQIFALPATFPAHDVEMYVGLYQGDTRLPCDQPNLGAENRPLIATIHFADAAAGSGGTPNLAGPPQAAPTGVLPTQSPAGQMPLPTYVAKRAKGPIHIDGVLDEADWKNATSTGPLVNSMNGAPTKYKTEAKILWDDTYLYIAFTCEDEDVWSDFTKHDDKLYTEEAVELFVDADGDGKTYNEIEIAPTNATFDAYFPARRQGMDLSWESGMVSAVKVEGTLNDPSDKDKGWVAEAKIPLKSFASVPNMPPKLGDKWRFNLYRLEQNRNARIAEGSAFSPLYQGDFHNLPRFGWLEFEK